MTKYIIPGVLISQHESCRTWTTPCPQQQKQTPIKHNHIDILAKDWGSPGLTGHKKKICECKKKKNVKKDEVKGQGREKVRTLTFYKYPEMCHKFHSELFRDQETRVK